MRFPRLQTLRAQARLILALLIALVLLSAGVVVINEGALSNANTEADHDRQMQLDSAAFMTGMLNEETAVRGFVNTGEQQFLEPYSLGQTQVIQAEGRLGAEVDPDTRTQFQRQENAASAWNAWADARVAAVTAKGSALVDENQSAVGKQLFDTFRSAAQALDTRVAGALASAQDQARSQSSIVVATTLAADLLIVAALVILGVVVSRSTLGPLAALFAAASSLAAGERVEIPLTRSANEVGLLARALRSWQRAELERLALARTATELGGRVELQEIFDLASGRLREVLDCPYVTVSLADPSGLRVVPVSDTTAATPGMIVPIASPQSQAFRSRQAVIADFRSPGWDDMVVRWGEAHSAGPVLAVPLVSGGDPVGVVTCARRTDQAAFTQADRERAELIVPSLAAAIRVGRLFENLREAAAKLELTDRHKSVFLASMSHELRTPLNAILGFSELMIDATNGQYPAATQKRFLEQIHSSGKHLLGLINDILDLSKIEAGQMELRLQPVSVGEVVEQVVTTIRPLAEQKQVRVEADAGSAGDIEADALKFKQMLLNLLSNAIKFTTPGGTVKITAHRLSDAVEIAVADTGIGIAESDQTRIFHEFQQVDSGYAREQQGTGLGLSLTQRFALLHGGEVRVQSELGKGSVFTLRMPLVALQPARSHNLRDAAAARSQDPSLPLVLVVENDAPAAELMSRQLERAGFRTDIVSKGSEVVARARALQPAVITLDILLPDIDGWEVLTLLKKDKETSAIPVVVISIFENPELCAALGAIDYFVKPVPAEELIQRLSRFQLGRHDAVRVLVVDDEQPNREMMAEILKSAGYSVTLAGGGREGIELARSTRPDLVVLDLMMPDVSGFDVVEALRADEATRRTPIMVVTGKDLTAEDRRQLSGQVSTILQRGSLGANDLLGELHRVIAQRAAPAVEAPKA